MHRNAHVFYEQMLCLVTSFINESYKIELCSYIKMAILYSRNVWKCLTEPLEALSDSLLPYWTVPRWIWTFRIGRMLTSGIHHSGSVQSFHTTMSVAINGQCMDGDKHWTAKKLAEQSGICGCTEFQNFMTCLKNTQDLLPSGCHVIWIWNSFVVKGVLCCIR
jgi:hypothetical protein